MNKFVLIGAALLTCAAFSSCKDDDPNFGRLPVVEIAPNTLTGFVTDLQGNPIAGATISCGNLNATTGADGGYRIENVVAGTYTISASANGMQPEEGKLVVSDLDRGQVLVWSAVLAKDIRTSFNVTNAGGGEGEALSDALTGNEKAHIEINASVPDGAVPNDVNLIIIPIYTEDSKMIGRANEDDLLIGADIRCSDPNVKLEKDLSINFAVDGTVTSHVTTKQLINGQWVDVDHSIVEDGIVVKTRTISAVGLFFPVQHTETTGYVNLTLNPDEWDNLYGTGTIHADKTTFNYREGSEYNIHGANTLEALLIERLARMVGPTYHTVAGSYNVNTDVYMGTGLRARGVQGTRRVTLTSRDHSVSATLYGNCEITFTGYNRTHHEGGGN